MTISMYSACVPVFRQMLGGLDGVLAKAETHVADRKIDANALLQARLFPDMFPLVRQVQIATDMAKNGSFRLAGIDPPKFEDDETTFAQLYGRIDRATEVMQGIAADKIDGSEARAITLQMRTGELHFQGQSYLLDFVIPNLFFHSTTTYAILREAGVPIDPATGIPAHNADTLETPVRGLFIAGVVVAGFDANKVFIENGRFHGEKIVEVIARRG